MIERYGPGYDDLMPHDLAHYVIEELFPGSSSESGSSLLREVAGIFFPAPEHATMQNRRRVERIGAIGRADMIRSEALVVLCMPAWSAPSGEASTRRGTSASSSPTTSSLAR